MFTMATFLGAKMYEPQPLLGAILATLMIFLPGLLLMLAFHKAWQNLNGNAKVLGISNGLNAAVVGFLIAAFYQPICSTAITHYQDVIDLVLGVIALKVGKFPVLLLMGIFVLYGLANAFFF